MSLKFERRNNLIFAVPHNKGDNPVFTGESINEAKRESHRLQKQEDGGLGRGSLQVR